VGDVMITSVRSPINTLLEHTEGAQKEESSIMTAIDFSSLLRKAKQSNQRQQNQQQQKATTPTQQQQGLF